MGTGIEGGTCGVGDRQDPVTLHPGGDRPLDLAVVEDVDVVIDDDDLLHGWVSGEGGHDCVDTVPLLVLPDGHDTVEPTASSLGEPDVLDPGHRLPDGLEDHGFPGESHEHVVLVATGEQEVEHGVLTGPDLVYLDDGLLPDEVVCSGDVDEGSLGDLVQGYAALEDEVGVGGDEDPVVAPSDLQGLAVSLEAHGGSDLELVGSEVHGCGRSQEDLRPRTHADGDVELLALGLGVVEEGEEVPWDQPDGDAVLVHDHHPVERDVLLALELGDDDTSGDVASAVLREVLGYGEGHEVDLPGNGTELGVVHDDALGGSVHCIEEVLHDGIPGDVEGGRGLLPGGEEVTRRLPTVEVLEDDRSILVTGQDPGRVLDIGRDGFGDGCDIAEQRFLD